MAGFENDVVVAKNLNFDEAAAKPHLGIINAAGKIPIGTGNTSPTPEILGGSITSPGGTITIGYSSPNITVEASATIPTTFTSDAGSASPIANVLRILGSTSAAGTLPLTTTGGGNTITVIAQRSQAIAAADATKVGLSNFNSADFSVTATGFVSASGTGILKTLTGNSGGSIAPTGGNINTLGTGSITIVGSGSTLTTQLTGLTNHAIQIGAGTATLTQLGAGTTGQVLQTNTGADPTWSTATYPSTTTINQVLYSSANNTVAGITAANNGTMISGTTGVPSWLANGTTGQVLTATTGSPPSWGTAPVTQVTAQKFTATGAFTYTPTSNLKYVIVELQGAGGGSGGAGQTVANVAASGGGGGGAYARFILTAAQVGASLSGSVGAAGTAGTNAPGNGGTGGSTTLATTSAWTAAGGVGGTAGTAGATSVSTGGAGGTVTTGTGTLVMSASGQDGGTGSAAATSAGLSGKGGNSTLGSGGASTFYGSVNNAAVGFAGAGYGGGAGGSIGFGTNAAQTGGAGANGIAIFTEFL